MNSEYVTNIYETRTSIYTYSNGGITIQIYIQQWELRGVFQVHTQGVVMEFLSHNLGLHSIDLQETKVDTNHQRKLLKIHKKIHWGCDCSKATAGNDWEHFLMWLCGNGTSKHDHKVYHHYSWCQKCLQYVLSWPSLSEG